MKRSYITWSRTALVWIMAALLLIGCDPNTAWNKSLFSELRLSGEITENYEDWRWSEKGKSLCSMTIDAKKELVKKIRIGRLGADVVAEEDAERERKAEEAKLIANAELEKATIDKAIDNIDNKEVAFDNTGRIKWSNNHRQNSW